MLHELVVNDLGVIERASILLGPGLTALTGETGAGKTLITEAIGLLAGGRTDPVLVRTGAVEASVEGRFVDDSGNETIVRRVIPEVGRSRAYLDGSLASAAALAEAVGALVEVHGQHGHENVLRPTERRLALDRYGRHDTAPLNEAQAALRQATADLEALGGDEFARAREIDLLQFQIDEIDSAAIIDGGEDERLAVQELTLGDATAHIEAAEAAIALLSADGPVGSAIAEGLGGLGDRRPFASTTERLYGLQAELADLVDNLRLESAAIDADPATLHRVQQRREELTVIRRKYGPDLVSVIEYGLTAKDRLKELQHHDERALEVSQRIAELRVAESIAAQALEDARRKTAPKLARAVAKELRQLALPKAEFDVLVSSDAGQDIDFAISMNPGAPVLPLAKVASGGELSRIMLALQLVVGGDTGTVVYDEVDAGVAGEAATSIGQALAGVGAQRQVLVVTHLPQVAAFADRQINIAKTIKGATTVTEVHELDREARIIELARMLSGSPDSDNARAHAAELLQAAAS